MSDDVLQTWDSLAGAWEDQRDFLFETTRAVSERMIELLDPQPGQTILELACGPGDTGYAIAQRIAPGTLIQSDISPGMVDAARRGAGARALDHIEHRVLDAQALDLPDASVDAIACRYGFMLMPDQKAAFAEARRVLRPGGRLVFAVWGAAEKNLWVMAMALPIVQAGKLPIRDPNEPGGVFSLASRERIDDMLDAAGFAHVAVEELVTTIETDDFDQWWERQASVGGPLAAVLREMPSEERARMRDGSREIMASVRDGSTYRIVMTSLVVSAAVPL